MAEDQSSADAALDTPEMPQNNEGGGERVKGGKKKSKVVAIGAVSLLSVTALWALMGGDEETQDTATQPQEPQQKLIGRGGMDDGGVQEALRSPDARSGGVGRERAEVLAEMDERQAVLDKIERGESAVILGEGEIIDEKEEPSKPAPVFGDVEPRERPAPKVASGGAGAPAPITGTPSAIRPTPRVQSSSTPTQAGGINQEALAQELARLQVSGEVNTTVHYSTYEARPAGAQNRLHTMTPALDEDKEKKEPEVKTGEMAMPGDTMVAYMTSRISSEQPGGVVRADIVSGNLRGARLLGVSQLQGERILVQFDQMVFEDEIHAINAQAVDPDTMDASVRDGIDRRLFTRYGVPILMGVAAIGIDYQAEKANPTTTEIDPVTGKETQYRRNSSDSFGDHALSESSDSLQQPLSQIAQNAANTPIKVWANPGAIGVMFLNPVPQ